jgi:hypothetical protein
MAASAKPSPPPPGTCSRSPPASTGKFYTQIVSGAPFEVLLAADDETPKKLIAEGHAVAGSRFTYAIGKLVLWSAQPGSSTTRAVLASDRFKHLAVANPKLAPYGAAAHEVLKARGLADALAPKLVTARASPRPTSSCHRQCRTRLCRTVAGDGAWQERRPVPAWIVPPDLYGRDPPGRGAAEGRREAEPGRQGPARLPEGRQRPADHPRHGYGH